MACSSNNLLWDGVTSDDTNWVVYGAESYPADNTEWYQQDYVPDEAWTQAVYSTGGATYDFADTICSPYGPFWLFRYTKSYLNVTVGFPRVFVFL